MSSPQPLTLTSALDEVIVGRAQQVPLPLEPNVAIEVVQNAAAVAQSGAEAGGQAAPNIFSRAASFVSAHPYLAIGTGVVLVAAGGIVASPAVVPLVSSAASGVLSTVSAGASAVANWWMPAAMLVAQTLPF